MSDTVENTGPITENRKGRLENLRPWPKGVSGNPGGRPKGIVGRAVLRQLRKRAETGETNLDAVARAQVHKAIKGDTRAAEFVRDSVDGRPGAGDGDRTNIGTINIQWNGSIPAWAQLTEPAPSQSEPCAIDVAKVPWAQSPTTLVERVSSDNQTSAEKKAR